MARVMQPRSDVHLTLAVMSVIATAVGKWAEAHRGGDTAGRLILKQRAVSPPEALAGSEGVIAAAQVLKTSYGGLD